MRQFYNQHDFWMKRIAYRSGLKRIPKSQEYIKIRSVFSENRKLRIRIFD